MLRPAPAQMVLKAAAFAGLILASSCGPTHDAPPTLPEPTGTSTGEWVIEAGKVVDVPPIGKPPRGDPQYKTEDAWKTDGKLGSPAEYFGAVELPFVDTAIRDGAGRVYVTVDAALGRLHVFAKNIPLHGTPPGYPSYGLPEGEVRLYLDHDRFGSYASSGAGSDVGPEDRGYGIKFPGNTGGLKLPQQRIYRGGTDPLTGAHVWRAIRQPARPHCPLIPPLGPPAAVQDWKDACGWHVAVGGINDNSGDGHYRVDVEFDVPLPPTLSTLPGGGKTPALGIAVVVKPPGASLGTTPGSAWGERCRRPSVRRPQTTRGGRIFRRSPSDVQLASRSPSSRPT